MPHTALTGLYGKYFSYRLPENRLTDFQVASSYVLAGYLKPDIYKDTKSANAILPAPHPQRRRHPRFSALRDGAPRLRW